MLKLAVFNSLKYSFNKKSRVSNRANPLSFSAELSSQCSVAPVCFRFKDLLELILGKIVVIVLVGGMLEFLKT